MPMFYIDERIAVLTQIPLSKCIFIDKYTIRKLDTVLSDYAITTEYLCF